MMRQVSMGDGDDDNDGDNGGNDGDNDGDNDDDDKTIFVFDPGGTRPKVLNVLRSQQQQQQQDLLDPRRGETLLNRGLSRPLMTKQVTFIVSNPLIHDQISIEYACRIQRLMLAMKYDNYEPDVICFVPGGGHYHIHHNVHHVHHVHSSTNISKNRILSPTDVGYIYFGHLCRCHDLELSTLASLCLDQDLGDDYIALQNAVHSVQMECIPNWKMDRLLIHFTLVSSDCHVCKGKCHGIPNEHPDIVPRNPQSVP